MSYTLFEIFPELEAKIAGLDFDIEQENNAVTRSLTPTK